MTPLPRIASVAALALLAGCATTGDGSVVAADAVPYVDTTLAVRPPTPSAQPSARPCTAADLDPAAVAATSDMVLWTSVQITMITVAVRARPGITPCRLDARPKLSGDFESSGDRLPIDMIPDSTLPNRYPRASLAVNEVDVLQKTVLRAGQTARVDLVACDWLSRNRYTAMQITVLGLPASGPPPEFESCGGVRMSRWYTDPVPDPVAHLRPEIQAPATVRVGKTLRYQVTLHNESSDVVKLDPCPWYSHSLDWGTAFEDKEGPYTVERQLNCAPGTVPAGGALTFEMRLKVPDGRDPGQVELAWDFGRSRGQDYIGTSAEITVTE